MNTIFISYRRDDTKYVCDRIYDVLVSVFGKGSVFRDIDGIPAGVDFRTAVAQAMNQCRVALVLIGPKWLTIADETGRRRLDNPNDLVRIEVEMALSRGMLVIPVRVQDSQMPGADDLPQGLKQLVYRNARLVRADPDFKHDMDQLIGDIGQIVPPVAQVPQNLSLPTIDGKIVRRAGVAIGTIWIVVVLLVFGLIGFGAYAISKNFSLGFPNMNSSAADDAHPTLTHFCTAMSNKDYHTAYGDLTDSFQQQIGSEANLPTHLVKAFDGSTVTVIGCEPFSQGISDLGYTTIDNTDASDLVDFSVRTSDGGASTVHNQKMYFVKVSRVWKIDRIQEG